MEGSERIEKLRIKVAEELQEQWLDINKIRGWLKGYGKIPEKAQEKLAQQIRALFSEFGLRPDLGHIIVMGDRPYITKEGLIFYAHKSGQLAGIEVEIVERTQDFCLIKATVRTKDGGKYEAYGDADKKNTNRLVANHILRMAETRAVNRALRVAFPIGLTSFEELAEQDILYDPETGEVIERELRVNSSEQASERQVSAIKTIADKRRLSQEQLKELLKIVTGKERVEDLGKEEASVVISELNKLAPKQLLIELQDKLKELGIKNGDKEKLYKEVVGKSSSKLFTVEEAKKMLSHLEALSKGTNGAANEEAN